MKYLKLFESMSRGYESISATQLVNTTSNYIYPNPNDKLAKSNNFIPFSEQSLNLIRQFGYRVSIDHNHNVSLWAIGMKLTSIIRQLPDEWFYVDIFLRPKEMSVSKRLCYKCDQIDSVINCLKDNLPISENMNIFESLKSYQEVDMSEYNSKIFNDDVGHEDTTMEDDKKLRKFIQGLNIDNWTLNRETGFFDLVLIRDFIKTTYVEIFKIRDEWFYVKVNNGIEYNRYKCDQWDGLFDCIKNIVE